jgi:AmmeMemoRadiSam system protein B
MRIVRQPAAAGRFYPGRAPELERIVDTLLARARASTRPAATPKALLLPHAGYVYSGPTAASGYAVVDAAGIERVLLLGPAHYVAFDGLALPEADAFATPLGEVRVVRAPKEVVRLPQVIRSGHAHTPEHSLEVHLPFLQRVFGAVEVVPLVVGNAAPDQVVEVIEACWGGPETLILISSDLSHYLPYAAANERDADTIARILALDVPLPEGSACGARAVEGMLLAARAHGLAPEVVDHRNSGDTAGDPRRVVGYAAIAFGSGAAELSESRSAVASSDSDNS